MSFRLFIYYCALVGAWMGVVGWAFGRSLAIRYADEDRLILQDGLRGLGLGVMISLGLGIVDGLWNVGWRRPGMFLGRVATAVVVGGLGGLAGGSLAQSLIGWLGNDWPIIVFFVIGWTVAGTLMGASVGAFEWGLSAIRRRNRRSALTKCLRCTLGGFLGGLIGAFAAYSIREIWISLFSHKDPALLWSPSALGFVMLGFFVGLLVGSTQVALKKAWIRVESGFRPGRELILTKDLTKIGRAEQSDLGLFGDSAVEKDHAHVVFDGQNYVLEDLGSGVGTYLNGRRLLGTATLQTGDTVQVGKNVMRFFTKSR